MKGISREKKSLEFEFDKEATPKLRVALDEPFVVKTEDAFCGYITRETAANELAKLPTLHANPPLGNPVTGPIFIEGVEKGDLLEITIEKIIVADEGVTLISPCPPFVERPLSDSIKWAELAKPHIQIIKHLPGPSGTTQDGIGVLKQGMEWILQPMIGTIAVAPEREVVTSLLGRGPWGGNLDCSDIKAGTKVFLNSYNDGGLLYIGDVHASQGSTEFSTTADETSAEVTLRCGVTKKKQVPFLRIETADSLIALYSAKPLERAVERSIVLLMEWLVDDYDMDRREIYMLISVIPDFRINVYQFSTVGAEFPKKYLPEKIC